MSPAKTEHGKVALEFAQALVSDDFATARSLLSDAVQDNLQEEFRGMIEYGDGPVTLVEVMNEMVDWPTKQNTDVGWAYVALAGESFSEAVAVIVSNVEGSLKITSIEWGRP